MPSTFVHGLLPSSCLLSTRRQVADLTKKETVKLAMVAFVMGNMPDLDIIPATLNPEQWTMIHRYWGHNLLSIIVWCTLGAIVLRKFVSPKFTVRSSWMIAIALVGSHVLLDGMGDYRADGKRFGVPLLWPFSNWEFMVPLRFFKYYHIEKGVNPLHGHITSYSFWHDAVFNEITVSVSLFVFWIVAVTALKAILKFRRERVLIVTQKNQETSSL